MDRYRDYDGIAWFYDKYWSGRYHREAMPVLQEILLSRLPEGASVLDLCCGSGHTSRVLQERGFRVTGIDGSAKMIEIARKNVPEADFIVADARAFLLPSVFDAVVSTFDSLNHVTEPNDLRLVFQNAWAALKPGGILVFDLNMEQAYLTEWNKMSATVEEDSVCIVKGYYDADKRIGKMEITAFRLKEQWIRTDVTLIQRCYTAEEVISLMTSAGFTGAECSDAARDLGMGGEIGRGRAFFIGVRGMKNSGRTGS